LAVKEHFFSLVESRLVSLQLIGRVFTTKYIDASAANILRVCCHGLWSIMHGMWQFGSASMACHGNSSASHQVPSGSPDFVGRHHGCDIGKNGVFLALCRNGTVNCCSFMEESKNLFGGSSRLWFLLAREQFPTDEVKKHGVLAICSALFGGL
jgi:hypothetical protein